ncbi:unnamed protein product [Medioppia subpectinata]|uniref:Adenosine kinase n=1 Tax=Medioppia subpectinata TaxID=1979941 RepID=A0A7R9PTG1_9ACAR|nr:unnamed protein product [Medioppia subpectinata]CAG2100415.1 unnamed protein product [Medioppia subpectinata]
MIKIVSPDSVMCLAQHAHEWGKDFAFNMGASYVVHKCTNLVMDIFPYIDFLFCSADEALAFATVKGYHTRDLKQVAKLMADEPKASYNNPRISNAYKALRVVVVTQRDKPVLMAKTDVFNTKEYPVPIFTDNEIVDTSGAGDAFIGGFLAMYIDGRHLDICVACGIYCASQCVQLSGCTLPAKMTFKC